ncbi:MAG: glycoside hydrolase family 88 protein [Bacteroidota bacterium]
MKTKFAVGAAIISCFLGCPEMFSQGNVTPTSNGANQNRSLVDLMNLITVHQMKDNELTNGECRKGDWDVVKKSGLPKAMYWSYTTGVTLLTMQRVYDITHDERILDFVNKNNRISADHYAYLCWQKTEFGTVWKTAGLEKLWRLDMLDDCGSMGAAILETHLRHGVEFTLHVSKLVDIIGNFVTNVQYRLNDGTFWRPNSPDGQTIWADDLYMSLPFLIRWAEYKNNPSLLNDAAQQIISYASLLQDHDGVWFHAYFVDKKTPSCCKWGRANGWVAVAIAEVLSVLPKDHPKYKQVLEICKKQLDGLIRYQSSDGLWHQVLDHPELTWGTETSCSAAFTYAIARGLNKGWLDKSYAPVVTNALGGLKLRINEAGGIDKVSRSTSIGNDLTYYNERPTRDDDYHGNGLMLFALTEVYAMQKGK